MTQRFYYIFSFYFILLFSLQNSYAQMGVSIAEGELTNKQEVQLNINISDAYKMKVSDNFDFYGADWINYQKTYFFKLPEGDGEKEVFVKFQLRDGTITDTFVAYTILDTKPPSNRGRVNFSRGNYTKYRKVEIDLKCEGATWMNISNSTVFNRNDWVPFRKHVHSWLLPSGDGIKKIYVKFKDTAGNETKVYTDHIKLDSKAPKPKSIEILPEFAVVDKERNIKYVNQHNRNVGLEMMADGAEYMKISNSMNFYGHKWRRYTDYLDDWVMEDDIFEGYKRVYIRFRDKAGNESSTIYTSIYVDTKPPINPRIAINDGDEYTKSLNVTLQLHATEAVEMRIANDKDFDTASEWEPISKIKIWKLKEGETGIRDVWVSYRDRAKNQSTPIKASIKYDKDPPTDGQIFIKGNITKTKDSEIEVRVTAKDALMMKIALEENFERAHWREYSTKPLKLFLGTRGGDYKIKVQFRDRARNLSEISEATIYQEIRPLSPRVTIDNNKEYNTTQDGKVILSLFCLNATKMMVSSDPNFSDAEWIEYTNRLTYFLNDPDGVKTIYAKFKTATETQSITVNDKINWDKTPPYNVQFNLKVLPTESRIYYTKDYTVTVKAEDAVAMQLTEDSTFYSASWKPYTELPFFYGMSVKRGPIGYRTLYIRFKDFAGNISEPLSKEIYFDATSPQNLHVKINVPESTGQIATPRNYTFIRDVALDMEMSADSAYFMRIADNPTWQNSEWVPFAEHYNYALKGDEGKKVIYIQFKDDHDNITRIIKKNIIWDRDPPTHPRIIINENKAFTKNESRQVIINPICNGADYMIISNNPDLSDGIWMHYRSRVKWTLTEGDGDKVIYGKFYDYAGNESFEARGKITLDRTLPNVSEIVINGHELMTNKLEVQLKITAEDADEMIISNDYSFASPCTWEPYRHTKKWKLENKDGEAKVYVKVRNVAGTQSAPLHSKIILDTSHPILFKLSINNGATGTDTENVTVQTKVSDDTIEMQLSSSENFSEAQWISYKPEVPYKLAGRGRQNVYVRFKDENGNISKALKTDIVVYKNVK
ncbi:hypothetical protein [Flammeovirga kamogawensis]|uniref:Ig-like domain-containing protein n=1 Tax=Flammeovirga kamogawensis TaxID=373891 RepID=A0ABX8GQW5_9BACT|nr:hypothetical protein [Flammeovirga kamogawensis]MBB6463192.1 hypothetical protein [Flammeovirga kamogawensis]QWG05955.1 hypothetical protein KM029_11305 [Flammeovirga kamogawensis]TRX67781.1 hypothetical protein EO216_06315 [Flammeovirga kamogawensis]